MTVINIPFIAEAEDKSTDSPIGIFTITWGNDFNDEFSADLDVIAPMANDYANGRLPKNSDLYDLLNNFQPKKTADFTAEEKAHLKATVQQLLKHYPIHSVDKVLSTDNMVDMWVQAFPKKAHEYFSQLLQVTDEAERVRNLELEDHYATTDQVMDMLIDNIPGTAALALDYGIVDSDYVMDSLKLDVSDGDLDILDRYQEIDSSLNWHSFDFVSERYEDIHVIDRIGKLIHDMQNAFKGHIEQAEEALEENND